MNILVCGANGFIGRALCEALAREGHECDVTHSLPEAERQLKRRQYDVIVTDLRMDGDRDGLLTSEDYVKYLKTLK